MKEIVAETLVKRLIAGGVDTCSPVRGRHQREGQALAVHLVRAAVRPRHPSPRPATTANVFPEECP